MGLAVGHCGASGNGLGELLSRDPQRPLEDLEVPWDAPQRNLLGCARRCSLSASTAAGGLGSGSRQSLEQRDCCWVVHAPRPIALPGEGAQAWLDQGRRSWGAGDEPMSARQNDLAASDRSAVRSRRAVGDSRCGNRRRGRRPEAAGDHVAEPPFCPAQRPGGGQSRWQRLRTRHGICSTRVREDGAGACGANRDYGSSRIDQPIACICVQFRDDPMDKKLQDAFLGIWPQMPPTTASGCLN